MTQTPAGWYRDPEGAVRWWDGAVWTDHVQPAEPPAPASPPPPAQPPAPAGPAGPPPYATGPSPAPRPAAPELAGAGVRLWMVLLVGAIVVAGIVLGILVILSQGEGQMRTGQGQPSGPSHRTVIEEFPA